MSDTAASSAPSESSTPSVFDEPYTPKFAEAKATANESVSKGKSSAFDLPERAKPDDSSNDDDAVEVEVEEEAAEASPETEESEEAPDAEEEAPKPPTKGTKDKPFELKDIADQFVKVKIDGKEQVISLKQAAENGMMRATFNNKLREVNDTMKELKRSYDAVSEERDKVRSAVSQVFSDPKEMFDILTERYPQTLEGLARGWYQQQKWLQSLSPEKKAEYLVSLERKKLEKAEKTQREKLDRERAELDESRAAAEVEKKRIEMGPWHEEALRKAGFPTIDHKFASFAKNLMRERAAETEDGEITREIYVQSIIDTAKLYGTKAPPRPRLAPRAAPATPGRLPRSKKEYPAGPDGFFQRQLDALGKGR